MTLEKKIISRNYIHMNDASKIWSFGWKGDKTKQINLEQINNKYIFSFPIDKIHYSTTFKDKLKLKKYIEYILTENVI